MINVSQALGPVFQEIIVAGVDFKSSSGGTVTLEGNSNNDGRIDPVNGRTGKDEPIEQAGVPATPGQNQQTPTPLAQPAAPTGPGLIIPVGGTRAEMRVAFQTGRKPTLTITEGGDKIRVFDPTGKEVLNARSDSIEVCGDSPQTFTIAAIAPSASLADIVITLTGDSSGPPARDIVRATAVPVDLDVDSSRDNRIDDADEKDEDKWASGTGKGGAVILPNLDKDGTGPAPDNWSGGHRDGDGVEDPANTKIDCNGDIDDIGSLWARLFDFPALPDRLAITVKVAVVAEED